MANSGTLAMTLSSQASSQVNGVTYENIDVKHNEISEEQKHEKNIYFRSSLPPVV